MPRALALIALAGCAALAAADLTPQQERRIDRIFHAWDEPDTPGMAVGVVQGGKWVYRKAFGQADLERGVPLRPDHRFFVASVSKQFTAFSILLLEEEGKLSLDDPVGKHIPELPDYGKPLTIRHILSHTSGIRDYYTLNNMRGRTTQDYYTDKEVLRLIVRQKALNFEPGTEYSYSNSGYFLAKEIVERISGKGLAAFVQERIFRPLGMRDSALQSGVTMLVPGRALAYSGSVEGGFSNVHNSDAVLGARGMITTLEDFRKWHENLKRNRLGKRRQTLITRQMKPFDLQDGTAPFAGLGLMTHRYKGLLRTGHSGWFAGYRSRVFWYPEEDTSIFVFANHMQANAPALVDQMTDVIFADKLEEDAAEKPKHEWVDFRHEAALRHVGLYQEQPGGGVLTISVTDEGLALLSGRSVRRFLRPIGEGRYAEPETGDVVIFDRNGLTITAEGARSVRAIHRPRKTYKPEDLKRFVGRYRSEELDATQEVYLKDGKLRIRTGHEDNALTPNEVGDFVAGFGRMVFDDEGYWLHGGRVRQVRFARIGR